MGEAFPLVVVDARRGGGARVTSMRWSWGAGISSLTWRGACGERGSPAPDDVDLSVVVALLTAVDCMLAHDQTSAGGEAPSGMVVVVDWLAGD